MEHGDGVDFGAADDVLADLVGGIRTREQLNVDSDIILLPEAQAEDIADLHVGQVCLGMAAQPSITTRYASQPVAASFEPG